MAEGKRFTGDDLVEYLDGLTKDDFAPDETVTHNMRDILEEAKRKRGENTSDLPVNSDSEEQK